MCTVSAHESSREKSSLDTLVNSRWRLSKNLPCLWFKGGARQVGKSTLLRQVLGDRDALFVNLDDAAARRAASEDPRGFVEQCPGRLLAIDEAQRVPGPALPLKVASGSDRRPGRFAITGSADLLPVKGVTDSLAGRGSG